MGAGAAQAPDGAQVEGPTYVLVAASQVSGRQTVRTCRWQPPAPSQSPFVPHEEGPWSTQTRAGSVTPAAARGSGVPAGTFTHRPGEPGRAHDRQRPVQASLQQTPSTQKPDLHSSFDRQAWPSPGLPQLPAAQVAGGTQSASEAHEVRQAPFAHRWGAQAIAPAATQAPRPSQVLAGTRSPPAQEAARHGVPARAGRHWPGRSPLQLRHGPSQALAQQTPWAQIPEPHSAPAAQAAPGPRPAAGVSPAAAPSRPGTPGASSIPGG